MINYQEFLNEKLILGHDERVTISAQPIIEILNKSQDTKRVFGKPVGLWYGFGDNWIEFMSYEDLKFRHAYKIYPNFNNIIVLKTKNDIINFTKKYHMDPNGEKHLPFFPNNDINWIKVSQNYDGIEIPNYYDVKMMGYKDYVYSWLYTWDVDSGCIWNASGIRKLKHL
jgi:hypothetical protein